MPFYWNGFKQTIRYNTFIIEDITNLDVVYNNFKSSFRNKIKKASGIIKISFNKTLQEFYEVNSMTFNKQNLKILNTYEFLKKQDNVLKQEKRRKIF